MERAWSRPSRRGLDRSCSTSPRRSTRANRRCSSCTASRRVRSTGGRSLPALAADGGSCCSTSSASGSPTSPTSATASAGTPTSAEAVAARRRARAGRAPHPRHGRHRRRRAARPRSLEGTLAVRGRPPRAHERQHLHRDGAAHGRAAVPARARRRARSMLGGSGDRSRRGLQERRRGHVRAGAPGDRRRAGRAVGAGVVRRRPHAAGAHDPLHRGPARRGARGSPARSRRHPSPLGVVWGELDPSRCYADDDAPARGAARTRRSSRSTTSATTRWSRIPTASRPRCSTCSPDRSPSTSPMHFTTEHRFPGAPERVAALMIDPEFEAAVAAARPVDARGPRARAPAATRARCCKLRYEYVGQLDPIARSVCSRAGSSRWCRPCGSTPTPGSAATPSRPRPIPAGCTATRRITLTRGTATEMRPSRSTVTSSSRCRSWAARSRRAAPGHPGALRRRSRRARRSSAGAG